MYEKEERDEIYREKMIAYRKREDLSRENMATIFGVTRQCIYNWETGKAKIPGPARLYLDVVDDGDEN